MKRMLKSQGATDEQAGVILELVEKNPELFQKIASEVEARVKNGEDKQQASMAVMAAHQEELKQVIGDPSKLQL
ncbi:MAG: hypothetical protein U9M92_02690 [Patescibacteria group bacterium]|nr:hypothetical protein [Patescibacteria group bacterium]